MRRKSNGTGSISRRLFRAARPDHVRQRAAATLSVVAGSALGFAGPSVGVRVAKPTALEAMTGPSGPGAAKNQEFAGKDMNREDKVERYWFNFQKIAWAARQDHLGHRASATLSVIAGSALGFGGLCHFSFCLPKKKSNQKKKGTTNAAQRFAPAPNRHACSPSRDASAIKAGPAQGHRFAPRRSWTSARNSFFEDRGG